MRHPREGAFYFYGLFRAKAGADLYSLQEEQGVLVDGRRIMLSLLSERRNYDWVRPLCFRGGRPDDLSTAHLLLRVEGEAVRHVLGLAVVEALRHEALVAEFGQRVRDVRRLHG